MLSLITFCLAASYPNIVPSVYKSPKSEYSIRPFLHTDLKNLYKIHQNKTVVCDFVTSISIFTIKYCHFLFFILNLIGSFGSYFLVFNTDF